MKPSDGTRNFFGVLLWAKLSYEHKSDERDDVPIESTRNILSILSHT